MRLAGGTDPSFAFAEQSGQFLRQRSDLYQQVADRGNQAACRCDGKEVAVAHCSVQYGQEGDEPEQP